MRLRTDTATNAGARPAASRGSLASLGPPLAVYGALGVVSIGAALARGRSPVRIADADAWIALPDVVGHVTSLVLGAALAAATIGATRQFVRRWDWARALHANLRPAVRGAGGGAILVLGVASAASEELFFRGLLTTAFGLVVSSLAFGLLHQVRGPARWVWAAWATVMGFLFGALLLATGSILGPIVAHAAINVANLRFLRDTEIEAPKARRLGGLLGRV
jgi:membrane protease YdiL (CAAX protease family)